jgi:hypothetical protein
VSHTRFTEPLRRCARDRQGAAQSARIISASREVREAASRRMAETNRSPKIFGPEISADVERSVFG